jgi:polysaccharide pyruvyl transferase WcaK-like protein
MITNKRYRVVLSNTYGHPNIGDEAILASMIFDLESNIKNVKIEILSRLPELTKNNHPNLAVIKSGVFDGIISTIKSIKSADLLVIGGGGIIQDSSSFGNLLFHLCRATIAILVGTPFICYGIGIGPLNSLISRSLTAAILRKARIIMVRDFISSKLLIDIGIPKNLVRITADPVLGI